jgi:hypothetical protein
MALITIRFWNEIPDREIPTSGKIGRKWGTPVMVIPL